MGSENDFCGRCCRVEFGGVLQAEHNPQQRSHPRFAGMYGTANGVLQSSVEAFDYAVGLRVVHRCCDGQDVSEAAVGGEGAHEVDMDIVEALREHGYLEDWCLGMHHDLACLAGLTLPGPAENVTAHVAPSVRLRDDGQGRFRRWVSEVLDRVKNRASSYFGK